MIEIMPGNYYVGFWTAGLPTAKGDYMACVWREETAWKLVYRFRYHKDDQSFDSKDEKSWYAFTIHLDRSEEEIVGKVNLMTSLMVEPKFYPVHGDDKKALEVMYEIPSFHMRMLEPDDPTLKKYDQAIRGRMTRDR